MLLLSGDLEVLGQTRETQECTIAEPSCHVPSAPESPSKCPASTGLLGYVNSPPTRTSRLDRMTTPGFVR